MRKLIGFVLGGLLIGCAPRQDPGIPIPDHRTAERDGQRQTAQPQTPTSPVPESGKAD